MIRPQTPAARDDAVSVVLLTKNRREQLRVCILSLCEQSHPPFEIIVVDDASTDGTEAMVRSLAEDHPQLKFVRRPGKGLANGRNAGVRAASGSFIAFLDDDCRAHRDWIKHGLDTFLEEEADIVRGPIVLPDGTLFAKLEHGSMSFGTGNIMYRKRIFEEMGLFDERFVYCAEDRDFGWRAVSHGFKLAFAPEATVYHPFYYTSQLSRIRRAWTVGRRRAENRVLLYKKHRAYRKELLLGVFSAKGHLIAWALFLGAMASLVNLLTVREPYVYVLAFIPFLVAYFSLRVFVDLRVHKYILRIAAMPYLCVLDLIETMYTAKGALKHRSLVL
jgi:GT2 family glycosyltransferase